MTVEFSVKDYTDILIKKIIKIVKKDYDSMYTLC